MGDTYCNIHYSSDICTVSFGLPRTLDFLWKINNKQGRKGKPIRPDFSVPSTNHPMNIMKAGSQTNILHRVPAGSKGGVRYSLSLMKIISQQHPATEDGPDTSTRCRSADEKAPSPKEKVVLLAGDSYFDRLDVEKLAKGKQKVFKVAKGGRKIDDVQQAIRKFTSEKPNLEIKQLFICVGTNDIRYCRERGVRHLKSPLQNFLATIKQLAPEAKIYVQSLLPIPSNGYRFGERNVVAMNRLIFDMCSKNKVFFIDAFVPFLNAYGNRNLSLFPKWDEKKQFYDIHPNSRGMGVLARQYIFLIHLRRFNPLAHN